MPVTCVITGTWRGANHAGTRRMTLMNVIASPAPTSTRATTAQPASSASASRSWPAAMTTPPVTSSSREPNRSMRTPTGICIAA